MTDIPSKKTTALVHKGSNGAESPLQAGLKSVAQTVLLMRKQPVEIVAENLAFLSNLLAVLTPASTEGMSREQVAQMWEGVSGKQKAFLLDLAKEVNRSALALMDFQIPKVARVEHVGAAPALRVENKVVVELRTSPIPQGVKPPDESEVIDLEGDDFQEQEVGTEEWAKDLDDGRPN